MIECFLFFINRANNSPFVLQERRTSKFTCVHCSYAVCYSQKTHSITFPKERIWNYPGSCSAMDIDMPGNFTRMMKVDKPNSRMKDLYDIRLLSR